MLLVVPLGLEAMWMVEFNRYPTQEERVAAYFSHMPEFLHARGHMELFQIVLALVAVGLLSVGAVRAKVLVRVVAVFAVIVAVTLILLKLFQLM